MSELHTVIVEAGLPYYSFYHNDIEYVIWLQLMADEDEKMYQITLAKVIPTSGGYGHGPAIRAMNCMDSYIESNGGFAKVIEDVFMVRVNDYLAAQGGAPATPITFQDLTTNYERFLYLVEKGLEYVDGQLILKLD